jgi:hypothetical protein
MNPFSAGCTCGIVVPGLPHEPAKHSTCQISVIRAQLFRETPGRLRGANCGKHVRKYDDDLECFVKIRAWVEAFLRTQAIDGAHGLFFFLPSRVERGA